MEDLGVIRITFIQETVIYGMRYDTRFRRPILYSSVLWTRVRLLPPNTGAELADALDLGSSYFVSLDSIKHHQ